MLAPFALVSIAMGVLAPVLPIPQEGEWSKAVAREIAVRSAAPELGRLAVTSLRTGASVTQAQLLDLLEGRVGPAAPAWVGEVSALDAAARAGLLLVDDRPELLPERRPELWAAALRVLDTRGDGPALAAALSTGLAAPFHGVRVAALDRLARALIASPDLTPFLPAIASAPDLTLETCGELSVALARAGARSEALAESALLARTRALEGNAPRALAELFDLWLDRPVSADAVRFLRQQFPVPGIGSGLVEALAMVAEVDSGPVQGPVVLDAVMTALDIPLAAPAETGGEAERFRNEQGLDEWDLDERSERLARRSGSAELGRFMLDLTSEQRLSPRRRLRCIQVAAWTLPMGELLIRARSLEEDGAAEVWRVVSDRLEPLPPAALRPWLADPRDSIRDAAAREVERRLTRGGEPELLPLAVELLDDAQPEMRSLAFSWLCEAEAPPEVWAALRAAFDREGVLAASNWRLTDRQLRWLAQLPRGVRIPAFRGLLMELVGRAGERSPAIVELLAPFTGDPDVAALLRRALEVELQAVEAAPVYPARLMPDGRAAAVASSLAAVEGAAATDVLVDGLRRSMGLLHGPDAREDARPQLPKVTCGWLQRSAAGRQALVEFLGEEAPIRVRYEAALQLAKGPEIQPEVASEVARRLTADFERVDGTLRARGLQALGRLPSPRRPGVERFLRRLSAAGGDAAEREMAIAVMGSGAMVPDLLELCRRPLEGGAPDLMDVEAAVAAARALADPAVEPRRALDELLDLVEATDARLSAPGVPELEGEALRQLRGVALIGAATAAARDRALASGRPVPSWRRLAAAVTRRPKAEGPSDIARRFKGEELGAVRFRWSAEVGAVEALPALTREFLPEGVGAAAEAGVDGRLLVMMGELSRRAGRGGVEAQRLLERGLFAMAGEPRTRPASRDLTFGRAALGRAILDGFGAGPGASPGAEVDAMRWERAALQATLLLVDWRQGRIARAVLEAEFGVADRSVQCDPEARLAALSRVFRGRAALARGQGAEVARAWAEGARGWALQDRDAAEALAALDEAIRLKQG
jgi:hypothetical protein